MPDIIIFTWWYAGYFCVSSKYSWALFWDTVKLLETVSSFQGLLLRFVRTRAAFIPRASFSPLPYEVFPLWLVGTPSISSPMWALRVVPSDLFKSLAMSPASACAHMPISPWVLKRSLDQYLSISTLPSLSFPPSPPTSIPLLLPSPLPSHKSLLWDSTLQTVAFLTLSRTSSLSQLNVLRTCGFTYFIFFFPVVPTGR